MKMTRWLLALAACSGPRQPEPVVAVPADAAIDARADAAVPRDAIATLLFPDAAPGGVVVIGTDSHPCGGYVLDRLYFEVGSAEIPARQRVFADSLAKMIACLLDGSGITKLEVQGHADDRERDPLRLSEERAVRIANLLTKHGVDPRILRPVGYSNKYPVDDKRTEAARAKNRRVDFVILERKED